MSETVPPLTLEDIRKNLKNPTFSVYLYVGKKGDLGWRVAETIYGLLPRIRIYLIKDISEIKELIGNRKPKGVVFGWDETVRKFLTKSEVEDFLKTFEAIKKARWG